MPSRVRVYIAGPISKGNLADNVNQATAAFVKLAQHGFAPLCPHWSVYAKPCRLLDGMCEGTVECIGTTAGNDVMTHGDWMGVDLPWVECAKAVLRLPGESTGADLECEHARQHRIPVFNSFDDLWAWAAKVVVDPS